MIAGLFMLAAGSAPTCARRHARARTRIRGRTGARTRVKGRTRVQTRTRTRTRMSLYANQRKQCSGGRWESTSRWASLTLVSSFKNITLSVTRFFCCFFFSSFDQFGLNPHFQKVKHLPFAINSEKAIDDPSNHPLSFIHPSIHLSVHHTSIHPLSIHLSVHLSVIHHPSVYPSSIIYPSILPILAASSTQG